METFHTCSTYGGLDFEHNITISQAHEAGVGLQHRTPLTLQGTERLLADLCRNSGAAVRLDVRETGRKWKTKS